MITENYLDMASGEQLENSLVTVICRKLGLPDCKPLPENADSLCSGLKFAADLAGITLQNRKVLILGSNTRAVSLASAMTRDGGTVSCFSAAQAQTEAEAGTLSEIELVIRVPEDGCGAVGPDLDKLPSCRSVIDLACYPRRTALMRRAEELGLPCADGLPMLVFRTARPLRAACGISENELKQVLYELRRDLCNIVIIGMPGSGKSSVAELISRKTGRKFVNIDTEVVIRAGKPIPAIFAEDGEAAFRAIEREETARAGALTGAVIATGGGVIKDFRNYPPLHQNGRIYYLRRELTELEIEGRPLSKNLETLKQLEIEREPLYCRFADAEIQNNVTLPEAAERIWEEYCEHIGD